MYVVHNLPCTYSYRKLWLLGVCDYNFLAKKLFLEINLVYWADALTKPRSFKTKDFSWVNVIYGHHIW